ncbi:unnamed protein product [Microthlaspi erraticum]|uniref:Uncharacterized protein n=1 Tax=Microthlaspi erraticum TaxID=1685480 RepID=A0A6D2JM04_9BRAS|nr:unnamed protein product [Microthlaspi erraticum]
MRILGETGLLPMAEYGIDSPGRDHLGDRTRWVVNRGNGDPTGCDCLGDGTRAVAKRVELAGRADLDCDVFFVRDGLSSKPRQIVTLTGFVYVFRSSRGCYKWWYQSMVHDHASWDSVFKAFSRVKMSRKGN